MNSAAVAKSKGFEGVFQTAALSDLIQMECLAMNTRAVRVDRAGTSGRIFFAGGQMVHAESGDLRGEVALFEMLLWTDGNFTIEDGVRSIDETIQRDWHGLLLEAAQRADEYAAALAVDGTPAADVLPSMNRLPGASVRDAFSEADVLCGVHFTEDGALLAQKGDNPDDLQATFAFVTQLSRLIGEALGAESLREVQVTAPDFKALCLTEGEQTVALIAGAKANIATLVKKLS